ncbi:MAG: hypothetical protein AB1393_09055 [Candidatus Edwardsbacteria bacterium]
MHALSRSFVSFDAIVSSGVRPNAPTESGSVYFFLFLLYLYSPRTSNEAAIFLLDGLKVPIANGCVTFGNENNRTAFLNKIDATIAALNTGNTTGAI